MRLARRARTSLRVMSSRRVSQRLSRSPRRYIICTPTCGFSSMRCSSWSRLMTEISEGSKACAIVDDLVNPHPSRLEREEFLIGVLRGVKDLVPLEVDARKLLVESFYLLGRERLEDVDQGERP